jgi:hypothetical protein
MAFFGEKKSVTCGATSVVATVLVRATSLVISPDPDLTVLVARDRTEVAGLLSPPDNVGVRVVLRAFEICLILEA